MDYYFLSINDILITPIYLLASIILIAILGMKFITPKLQYYFFYGLACKVFFSVIYGIIYEFYYHGGDTSAYYYYGTIIGDTLWHSPVTWLKLIMALPADETTIEYISQIRWFNNPSTYFPCRIVGVLAPFCFNTYSVIAIYYAMILFTGQWVMFLTFNKLYPGMTIKIAFAVFFVPSVIFWSSGIMKDGLALSALGWLLFAFHRMVVLKKNNIQNVFLIIISAWVLYNVKLYILICFVLVLFIWFSLSSTNAIRNRTTRVFLRPIFISIGIGLGIYLIGLIASANESLSFDNILATSQSTAHYIQAVSKEWGGSYYSIGNIEPTLVGILKVLPAAVNVTLFRPYIWEARNIMIMFSALESTFTLLFTLFVIYKRGVFGIIHDLIKNPFLFFSLTFVILFGFSVGISSGNFGALVRYKLPLLPFYWVLLFVLRSNAKK